MKAVQTLIHSKQQDAKVITKSLAVLITVCQCLPGTDLITINWQRIIELELKAELEPKVEGTVSMKAKQA